MVPIVADIAAALSPISGVGEGGAEGAIGVWFDARVV
jgi:hypothetical protein